MLRSMFRWTIALGLMAGVPAAALAQDSTCRSGLFTRQAAFAQAEVTASKAFFRKDTGGCPSGEDCRSNSYVVEGDAVVIGRRLGEYVCAFYPNDDGGTAGWLDIGALFVRPLDAAPPLRRWLGDWSDGASADVTILTSGGRATIMGTAFWPARPEENTWPTIHIGEVDGPLAIFGHRATYADDNLCELELTLLPDFLLIADNHKCGGVNVTFSGVYRRVPRSTGT